MPSPSSMLDALRANGPAADRAEGMNLYDQFVGSWDATLVDHLADGAKREAAAEIHFEWVLEGRAVQDVWISPPRRQRVSQEAAARASTERPCGSTIQPPATGASSGSTRPCRPSTR